MRCAFTRWSSDAFRPRTGARLAAATAAGLLVSGGAAEAGSGFAVRTQSVATLGMAQAGMATGAGDVATMVYNPATLAATSGRSALLSGVAVGVVGDFDSPVASTVLGTPILGGDGGGEGGPGALPSVYLAADLAEGWRAGLAVTSLYGLGSHYADGWAGRYHVLDSEILSFVAQPTLSWRPLPGLALGAGLQVQYTRTRSTAAIDFGTIDAALTGGAFGGAPGGSDGSTEAVLDDVGVAVIVGALAEPWPGGAVGVGFRSELTHDLEGRATFDTGGPVGAGVAAATGAFSTTGASASLRLPASLHLGVRQRVGEGVTVHADVNWMGWSRLGTLRLDFDDPAQEPVATRFGWRDSLFVAAGTSWRVTERLTLRAGAAWDQSAARGGRALPAVPEGESIWLAAGLGYDLSARTRLDAVLGGIFTEDVTVSTRSGDPGGLFRGNFDGEFADGAAWYAGLQVSLGF